MTDNFLTKNRKVYEYQNLDSSEHYIKEDTNYEKVVKRTYTKSVGLWADFLDFYRDSFNPDYYVKKLSCLMLFVFFIEYLSIRSCVYFYNIGNVHCKIFNMFYILCAYIDNTFRK
jgi:hypothetical protein